MVTIEPQKPQLLSGPLEIGQFLAGDMTQLIAWAGVLLDVTPAPAP